MTTFKVFFGDSDIRRFKTPDRPSFEEFQRLLVQLYPLVYHPELRFQYVDSEGDRIGVTSELEFREMFAELEGQPTVKIYISSHENPSYFKDGPPPTPISLYSTSHPLGCEDVEEIWANVKASVPKALESLFPNGKILPHNVPSWLQGVVNCTNLPGNEVDMDVDISALFNALETRALSLFDDVSNKANLLEARRLLMSELILSPNNAHVLYNLACAEALLDNKMAALGVLADSVAAGFSNVLHMSTDEDLANIRGTAKFDEIIETLKQKLSLVEPEPQPAAEQEPVSEPEPAHQPSDEPSSPEPAPEPAPEHDPEPFVVVERSTEATEPVEQSPFPVELGILHDMGFLDDSVLIPALNKTNGSVEATLVDLLG